MATFVGFLMVAAIFAAVVVAASNSGAWFEAMRRVWAAGILLCRGASWAADYVLAPGGAAAAQWRYLFWCALNLLPFAIVAALTDASVASLLPSVLPFVHAGIVLIVACLFQVLVLGAALVARFDDYDVLEGVQAKDTRRIGGARTVVGAPVVALALVLFVTYAAAVAWWLADLEHATFFISRPETGFAAIDYVLVALWSLPTALILAPIDWLLGADTAPTFAATAVARGYVLAVFTLGFGVVAGIAALALQSFWQTRRAIRELADLREGNRRLVLGRLALAPATVSRGILSAAIRPGDDAGQKRLLEACRDLGLVAFPLAFCGSLDRYDEEIQCFGLERALELFRQQVSAFDSQACRAIVHRTASLLRGGGLPCETRKRIVRLTVAILSRRQDLKLEESVMASMLAEVARQLKAPEETPDPAYRGLLQDLRGVLALMKTPRPAAAKAASAS